MIGKRRGIDGANPNASADPKGKRRRKPSGKPKAPPRRTRAEAGQEPKSTQVQAQHRREAVEDLYRRGVHVDGIVDRLIAKFPTANKRNVEADIHLIRERWREQVRLVFDDDVRSWFVFAALEDRVRAIDAGDLKLAYAIARDIAKLAGVNLADLTVDHRNRAAEDRVLTWVELMAQERARRQLPPADFVVIEDPQPAAGAEDDPPQDG